MVQRCSVLPVVAEAQTMAFDVGAMYGLTRPLAEFGENAKNAEILASEMLAREGTIKVRPF